MDFQLDGKDVVANVTNDCSVFVFIFNLSLENYNYFIPKMVVLQS
jgi:hypothetical protein